MGKETQKLGNCGANGWFVVPRAAVSWGPPIANGSFVLGARCGGAANTCALPTEFPPLIDTLGPTNPPVDPESVENDVFICSCCPRVEEGMYQTILCLDRRIIERARAGYKTRPQCLFANVMAASTRRGEGHLSALSADEGRAAPRQNVAVLDGGGGYASQLGWTCSTAFSRRGCE